MILKSKLRMGELMIFKKSISIFFTLLITAMILSCDGDRDEPAGTGTTQEETENVDGEHTVIIHNSNSGQTIVHSHDDNGSGNNNETEEQIMITAIPEYPSYFLSASNNRLYGLSPDGPQEIIVSNSDEFPLVFKNFFTVNAVKYFHVSETDLSDPENPVEVEKFYSQVNGAIELIDELPAIPASKRVSLSNSEFSIADFDYQGTLYSDVKNIAMSTGMTRCGNIDGFSYHVGVGLYLNVSEKKAALTVEGLYFYPVKRTSINKVLDSGRVW